MKDPYKVLGVGRGASAAEIKRAYRQLAKKLHPDLNPGNKAIEHKFKDVSQAYGILGDKAKRTRFDNGEIDASGQRQGGFYRDFAQRGGGDKYRNFEFGQDLNIDDIISDFFGGRGRGRGRGRARGRTTRLRGADVSYTVPIGFLDAAVGAKKRVRLSDGKALNIKIPPGTEDRQTLRLKGQGIPGQGGGGAGNAYVEVHIQPHPYFTRKDNNVHLELPVSLQEAVLGATVNVPTVHGKVSMKIPAGSNTGTTLRLKGKGIAHRKTGAKGDQYVRLKVTLPDKPDKEFKEFMESWGKTHRYDPRRKAGMD